MPDGRRTLLLALAFFRAALGDGRRTFPAHLAALRAVFLTVVRGVEWSLADGAGLRLLRGHGASPPFAGLLREFVGVKEEAEFKPLHLNRRRFSAIVNERKSLNFIYLNINCASVGECHVANSALSHL